jgi:hypothetical protein
VPFAIVTGWIYQKRLNRNTRNTLRIFRKKNGSKANHSLEQTGDKFGGFYVKA